MCNNDERRERYLDVGSPRAGSSGPAAALNVAEVLLCCLLSLLLVPAHGPTSAQPRLARSVHLVGRVCLGASQRMACSAGVARAQRRNSLCFKIDLARDQGRWNDRLGGNTVAKGSAKGGQLKTKLRPQK